jgi:hypothetical protein
MSSAPASAAHGHDAHEAHAFTGEPVQALPADEPRTPGWLPLLGMALFTGAAAVFLAGQGAPTLPSAPPVVKSAAAPPPTATAPAATAAPAAAAAPAATGTGSAAVADAIRKLSPEQVQQMRKRLEEKNAKGVPSRGRVAPVR